MKFPADDPARWPLSRFAREFMPSHWDGRVALASLAVNWGAGLICALTLLLLPGMAPFTWVHVLLFGSAPVIGFLVFARDAVAVREDWKVLVSVLVQGIWAVLPWAVVIRALMSSPT